MVSVVIAAYNTEKYIAKCLESLKRQTYTDFEAIAAAAVSKRSFGAYQPNRRQGIV